MNRKVKRFAQLSVILILTFSLFLAGCSSKEKTSGGKNSGSEGGQKEFTLWHGSTGIGLEALKALVESFEKAHPDIKVKMVYTEANEGADQKLLTSIAGGNPPDVATFDRFKVGTYAAQGSLTDLTEMAEADGITEDRYYPYAWQEANYDGKLFAIPYSTDARLLYYNKDHFKEVGLDPENPPKTIAELEEAAEKLTIKEGKRFKRIGLIPWYSQGWLYSWGWSFGGEFYNKDTGEITANDPKIVEALQWMTDFGKKYNVEDISGFESAAGSDALDPFISGQLSMKVDGNWTVTGINKYKPDLNFGVTPIPTPTGTDFTTWSGGHALIIPKGAKNVETAWQFLKYFGSPEGAMAYYSKLEGDFSVQPAVNEELGRSNNPILKQFVDILPNSNHRPVITEGQLLWNELASATENSTRGKGTPQENLDKVTEAVNKALKEKK
ncbi:ABC transporter substrate-binding protein [Lederbergia citrea]|uniref:ABC transporter substrate-binding protein n=1 Tax=Lederbergia citrea TaxID=2833581 RepID=A0A942UQN9_9BACI|nr:ABC transporter substrate-binding protein [Lederbergia citrea]MBS4178186.1 ABC transporter substrate-binding protein [Lederbergia citrea]MBS4204862.1 ABC transporter substrate-binding protein [Lederbergia citrea]MBS4223286.1 ABC transporter substrate-binding protein [Lederbergia citrea]